MAPRVIGVACREKHNISKQPCEQITLVAGYGVKGDAHFGKTVKHRSRIAKDPSQPNLRQVHLIHAELFSEVAAKGFTLGSGQMGENITTAGLDLLNLPTGTQLSIGTDVIIEITGLRNPCNQINGLAPGLMNAMLDKDDDGNLVRKSGIMGVVLAGGGVSINDEIKMQLPPQPHQKLLPV